MTESIGTARLDIVVDTSSLDAGVTKAKRTTQDMANAAKGASASMEQNTKRQIASLEKQIATLGKSKEEIIKWRIEQQTSGKVAADLAAKLEQQVKHINNGGKAFSQYGLSAKQTSAALRGVPAQITDIAVALQSGQRPITVLLQQGGQLKDMFGGIVPAARALGGAVLGLINPLTLAAGATIGLAVAFSKSEEESAAFNKALILTGNNAGLSVKQLREMASEIGRTTSASAIGASDTLAKVAATGRFTADQIGLVAKAAINMQAVSGQAIEETIQQFVQLQDDPLATILKLNDAQHFLTATTVRQIEEFKSQGREADAAALAIKSWADTINTRAPQAEASMSGFAKILASIKQSIGDDTAKIVGFFDAAESGMQGFVNRHEQLINKLKQMSQYVPLFGGTFATLNPDKFDATKPKRDPLFANVVSGSSTVVDSRAERARIAAEDEFGKIRESHLSKAKQLEEEIKHIREVGKKAGIEQSKIEEQVAAARAAAATSTGGGRGRSGGGRASVRALPDINKGAAEELARQAAEEDRATQSFLDMAAALDGPLAQAQREHEQRVQRLNELARQSPVAAEGLSAALDKEAAAYAKTTEEIKKQLDPVGQVLAAQALELDMIGKTNAERAVMNALIAKGTDLRSAEAQAALQQARANQTEAESRQQAIDLMDDFRRGAADALTDFVTGAKSAKDALKDFFNTLAEEITKAIAQQWIKQLFGSQGTSQTGSAGGWISSFLGLFGGGSANGNAFVNGDVQAFANGGVVNRTTPFGMSGGRFGIMGEAGPEAILPLHRGPDGKLGVRMEAANDDRLRPVNNYNTQFVLPQTTTPQTQAQIAQNQQRAATRATARNR